MLCDSHSYSFKCNKSILRITSNTFNVLKLKLLLPSQLFATLLVGRCLCFVIWYNSWGCIQTLFRRLHLLISWGCISWTFLHFFISCEQTHFIHTLMFIMQVAEKLKLKQEIINYLIFIVLCCVWLCCVQGLALEELKQLVIK